MELGNEVEEGDLDFVHVVHARMVQKRKYRHKGPLNKKM